MVVGIWDPKRGTLIKGYGTGDLTDPQATIAIDDHVRIASVTKSFTATAILQLVAAKSSRWTSTSRSSCPTSRTATRSPSGSSST